MATLVIQGNSSLRPQVRPVAHAAASSQRLQLTRRGRLLVSGLCLLATATVTAIGIGVATPSDATATRSHVVTYTVMPGDSLWSIAARINTSGDPRELVYDMTQANPELTRGLVPGQQVQIPVR